MNENNWQWNPQNEHCEKFSLDNTGMDLSDYELLIEVI